MAPHCAASVTPYRSGRLARLRMAPIALYTHQSTCPKVQVEFLLAIVGELLLVIEDFLMVYTSNYALRKLLEIRGYFPPESDLYRRLSIKILEILQEECAGTSIVETRVVEVLNSTTELLDSCNVKILYAATPAQYDQGTGEEASKSGESENGK